MASIAKLFPGVAVITGAGGTGIGAAVAKGFAQSACTKIAITDINSDSLGQTRDAILAINPSAEILTRAGDIADESFVDSFFDETSRKFTRIDYAVNCAGILGSNMIKAVDMATDAFDQLNNINYRGSWLSSRAQLRNMLRQEPLPEHPKQRGSIVNIASQLGVVARPGAGNVTTAILIGPFTNMGYAAAYCASKAAIINMTRANAIDYSDKDIRINCVCPGVIETPMTSSSKEIVEALRPAIDIAPMKRMGTADEVANAILFLCSSRASFIQGHALVVDGGYTIN